jgi:hypothetical protein
MFKALFMFAFLSCSTSWGRPLSASAIYYRCHSQFVRKRPVSEDALLKSVKAGELTAVQACLKLLAEVNVNNSEKANERSLQILRTFQAFHMTWFPNKNFIKDETDNPTTDFYDANEMGYHLTSNLFAKNSKYSDVVTSKTSFRGIRQSSQKANYLIEPMGSDAYQSFKENVWALQTQDRNSPTLWNPQLIEFGALVGLRELKAGENQVRFFDGKRFLDFSASATLGGGILGTIPYILLNSSQKDYYPSDGGLLAHRSWSKAVFADLLCRELPVVRKKDAAAFVQKESPLPFRKENTCMQCHSSMDPMAWTIRYAMNIRLDGKPGKNFLSPRSLALYPPEAPPETAMTSGDPQFHLRPPVGKLYFRTYQGELVDQKISGVQELGEALANLDDLYICAAKRYFEFMTGIEVKIFDFSSENSKTPPAKLLAYRNFVVSLGHSLKKTQSLKLLVQDILASPFYSQSDYGNPL